jgi:hypothetical protein
MAMAFGAMTTGELRSRAPSKRWIDRELVSRLIYVYDHVTECVRLLGLSMHNRLC